MKFEWIDKRSGQYVKAERCPQWVRLEVGELDPELGQELQEFHAIQISTKHLRKIAAGLAKLVEEIDR